MTVVGEDIKCVGIHYNRSLAVFQLFQQGSFRFLVSSQSRTDADCLIVVRVGRYGKTGFVDVGFYDCFGYGGLQDVVVAHWCMNSQQPYSRTEAGAGSEEEARKKIEKLGGYDKLYRIKLEADYLRKLTMDGARKRYGEQLTDEQQERLNFELHIMKTMGFPGYFLIVQDFIRAAREELDVSVGPGRGSAAGSAVAYCLGITQIDPIAYDLLFERFLNPDRISLPDIDVDFDDDGRGRVLNWVTQKYGKEKVAHIITYGTMATKMAIKDVARVQKLLLAESDRLCKLVPDKIPDKKLNLPNAIEYVPELKAAAESDNPVLRDTMRYAQMLEGNVRGTGVHACGTIICRDDITDWVPVSTADDKETGQKMLVTQYEGSVIEDTGLIKMDFLGLKTLSIIKDAVENIRLTTGRKIDIDD